jgi:CheY-like chemotaxis protein
VTRKSSNLLHFAFVPDEASGEAVRPQGQTMRVLVVEDEALIRMLICDLLAEIGFECREAADADRAFAALDGVDGWRPDILVTDYNLGPGPNGAEVAAEAVRRLPGLPVIYATGNPECLSDVRPQARVLAKPFAAADLILAIDELRAPAALPLPELPSVGDAGTVVPALLAA